MADTAHEVLLYYAYFPVADPEGYAGAQRLLCQELGLLGRIIVAEEGINGTVSGPAAEAARYREAMNSQDGTRDMVFKVDPADGHVFRKLSVKVRPELVTLGLPAGQDPDPGEATGQRLSPRAFYEAMQRSDAILLDGRNNYETELGRFRGALCPDVEAFRDFPRWVRENLAGQEDRPVLTYCTGGIRCEKLSGFLLNEGFKDVSQLDGGIVSYGRDETVRGRDFEGSCYVFDGRIKVDVNHANPEVVSRCNGCGQPCDRYQNCAYPPCNAQFFCCEECERHDGRYCKTGCRKAGEAAQEPPGGMAGEA